jgi:hypothetical protein
MSLKLTRKELGTMPTREFNERDNADKSLKKSANQGKSYLRTYISSLFNKRETAQASSQEGNDQTKPQSILKKDTGSTKPGDQGKKKVRCADQEASASRLNTLEKGNTSKGEHSQAHTEVPDHQKLLPEIDRNNPLTFALRLDDALMMKSKMETLQELGIQPPQTPEWKEYEKSSEQLEALHRNFMKRGGVADANTLKQYWKHANQCGLAQALSQSEKWQKDLNDFYPLAHKAMSLHSKIQDSMQKFLKKALQDTKEYSLDNWQKKYGEHINAALLETKGDREKLEKLHNELNLMQNTDSSKTKHELTEWIEQSFRKVLQKAKPSEINEMFYLSFKQDVNHQIGDLAKQTADLQKQSEQFDKRLKKLERFKYFYKFIGRGQLNKNVDQFMQNYQNLDHAIDRLGNDTGLINLHWAVHIKHGILGINTHDPDRGKLTKQLEQVKKQLEDSKQTKWYQHYEKRKNREFSANSRSAKEKLEISHKNENIKISGHKKDIEKMRNQYTELQKMMDKHKDLTKDIFDASDKLNSKISDFKHKMYDKSRLYKHNEDLAGKYKNCGDQLRAIQKQLDAYMTQRLGDRWRLRGVKQ